MLSPLAPTIVRTGRCRIGTTGYFLYRNDIGFRHPRPGSRRRDALQHRHPVNDVPALEAIAELFACLPRAKAAPEDVETRYRCQLAAWMSFFGPAAVQYGLSHRLGRIVGATFGVAHGVTSAVTLAHVMRYKAETEAPRLAPMAHKLKLAEDNAPADQATLAAADAVTGLVRQLDLPFRLREVGVPENALEEIAAQAADEMGEDPAGVLRVVRAAW